VYTSMVRERGQKMGANSAGWLFSSYSEAMHVIVDYEARAVDGVAHALLLNPVTADGKRRYTLSRKNVLELLALAAHEVAHVTVSLHNEEYANLLTDIQRRLDQNVVWRRIRTEVKGI